MLAAFRLSRLRESRGCNRSEEMEPLIYLAEIKNPIDDNIFNFLLEYVEPYKRDIIRRHPKKDEAERMLVGDILVKYVLKTKYSIPMSNLNIQLGEFGKPYLPEFPDIHFNISHSGNYVVCAFSDSPVGIDVQTILSYKEKIAKRILSYEKVREIEESQNPDLLFTTCWSEKEALLKKVGCGFSGEVNETDLEFKRKTVVTDRYVISLVY